MKKLRTILRMIGLTAVVVAFAVMLVRDRGRVGRVVAFEVDGVPHVTIFGRRRDNKSGGNLQSSVITWNLARGERACGVGFTFGGFRPVGVAGRYGWIDRGSSHWSEIALWDLATCEERFDADHFRRGSGDPPLSFGTNNSTRTVDPFTGRLYLDRGYALEVNGTVVRPPDDSYVMTPTPSDRTASCRFRSDVPACDAAPLCAGVVAGRVRIAASGAAADAAGPVFVQPTLLGSPGMDTPCVRVLAGMQAPELLVRHGGGSGPGVLPPGIALVTAEGGVRWNIPAPSVDLHEAVIAVIAAGGDGPLTIVSADDGWQILGGYTVRVVRLDRRTGAVLARVDLP